MGCVNYGEVTDRRKNMTASALTGGMVSRHVGSCQRPVGPLQNSVQQRSDISAATAAVEFTGIHGASRSRALSRQESYWFY